MGFGRSGEEVALDELEWAANMETSIFEAMRQLALVRGSAPLTGRDLEAIVHCLRVLSSVTQLGVLASTPTAQIPASLMPDHEAYTAGMQQAADAVIDNIRRVAAS